MLTEQTVEKMVEMKMFKMAESFKERLSRSDHQSLSQSEFVGFLIDDEFQARQTKKLSTRLRGAKFKQPQACMENIDYRFKRGLHKQQMLELAQMEWVKKYQNMTLTGPSGVGKSYLAQAIGHQACLKGMTVMYIRCAKLFMALTVARADGSYPSKLKRIAKANVLVLDDYGLNPLTEEHKQDLFEIIEDRHGAGSTVLTSQLPTDHWHEYIGGGMLGDGICDRILHNCHKLTLKGESYRKKASDLT